MSEKDELILDSLTGVLRAIVALAEVNYHSLDTEMLKKQNDEFKERIVDAIERVSKLEAMIRDGR